MDLVWYGREAGVDYTQCKDLEKRARDSSVKMQEREKALKELSVCRKNAEKKFLDNQK
ncbi:hypothetical protein [Helicobacter trogontum]|uniref:hypothetical protein n=1 Tax=Helicobacter trogontum TaxID=50960 RepID=UPI001319BF82|nr:hypothetical protein [Helicobacter trogontum]